MISVKVKGNVFCNMDCIGGARRHIPDGAIDLIITDPPYGIEGDKLHRHYNRDESFVVDGYVEVPAARYRDFSNRWIAQAARILRPGGAIFIVSGYTRLPEVLSALGRAGLREVNHIIWKFNFGVFTSRKFVSSHYHILYYEKPGGRRTFNTEARFSLDEQAKSSGGKSQGSANYRDREDVWIINREYKPGRVKNKNELPMELLKKMILYASSEGDTVCDMFMGGFSTAVASIGLGRKFVGFEKSRSIFEARVGSMRDVVPGSLLDGNGKGKDKGNGNAGKSASNRVNSRKRWTDSEREAAIIAFDKMVSSGSTKGTAVERLMARHGRGRWAIVKMLAREGR